MNIGRAYSIFEALCHNVCQHIPEQFTVKAHPALFEGEGEGQKK